MYRLKAGQLTLAYSEHAEPGQRSDLCNTNENVVAELLYFLDRFVIYWHLIISRVI
ncbi:hypothetical protein ACLPJF_13000 [Pseudomonas vlassakiae]|uniref:hypothetical protein n=1 Tax=Pseudomonas vlassakiae TaxID=485888 RepID=UPI003AAFAEBF